jgi:DHA1 family bicyclomycin/chloramphenicol resistance-like MFS transporter
MQDTARHPLVLALIVAGTVLGLAGTDLVLPAVPSLPGALGGTHEESQFVLAAFTAGAASGLLLFGELGGRLDQRQLLIGSLLGYAVISGLCSLSSSVRELIWLRFVQGAAGSAPAVFAPGMLRALYGDARAVGALGLLGSVESLTPALAPVAGLWLLEAFGWQASFDAIAVLGTLLAVIVWFFRERLPVPTIQRASAGYSRLLRRRRFLRQALSHAFTLAALLVFVLGAPTVITTTLGGTLRNFIVLQVAGISLFIVCANLAGALSRRFGARTMIMGGTALVAAGAVVLFAYAAAGGGNIIVVTVIFLSLNVGLGLRGPPGFHAALVAADGDDARGAALVAVAILAATALGTAAAAPFISQGLLSITAAAAILSVAAVLLLAVGSDETAASTAN